MKLFKVFLAVMLVVPAWLAAQEDNTAGCVISSRKTHVKIAGNKQIATDSVEMTVLDRRGERYTSFSFQCTKGDKFSVNYASVSDANGNVVRKLKKSDILKSQYTYDGVTFYDDEYVRYFDLRHNSWPYRISYSVTNTTSRFMSAGYLSPAGRCDIDQGVYVVEVPAGYPLKILSRNLDQPEKTGGDGTDIYTWRYKYEYRKPETNASPMDDVAPWLEVLPATFDYGVKGSYESWESFGNWAWALNEGLDELPDVEKTRIDQMQRGVDDKREKVRILYHYLQDRNRYINVKIALGGLRSYPAEYVCNNRFGDCKALCNYMCAILKYAGIEAYYTLADLDQRVPRFDEDFPNNAFNHIIVTVPLEDETLFLECTSKNYPMGYYGSQNQGRKALVTKQSGSRLVDVPAMTAAQMECVYDFKVECPDDRSSRVLFDGRYRGKEFESFVAISARWNRNDAEMYMRNYFLGGNLQMIAYGIERPHRDSTFVDVHTEAANSGMYRMIDKSLILNNMALRIPAYELPGERKTAVRMDLPRADRMRVEYLLDGITPVAVPRAVAMESPWGRYEMALEISGEGRLTLTKSLELNAGTVPLDEYEAFYDFMSRVRSYEHSKFHIKVL